MCLVFDLAVWIYFYLLRLCSKRRWGVLFVNMRLHIAISAVRYLILHITSYCGTEYRTSYHPKQMLVATRWCHCALDMLRHKFGWLIFSYHCRWWLWWWKLLFVYEPTEDTLWEICKGHAACRWSVFLYLAFSGYRILFRRWLTSSWLRIVNLYLVCVKQQLGHVIYARLHVIASFLSAPAVVFYSKGGRGKFCLRS
jgi:hypothetical protein